MNSDNETSSPEVFLLVGCKGLFCGAFRYTTQPSIASFAFKKRETNTKPDENASGQPSKY